MVVSAKNRAFQKNIPVRFLGTRFEARNCISKLGPQHFLKRPVYYNVNLLISVALIVHNKHLSQNLSSEGGNSPSTSGITFSCFYPR
jgi:hypothetical protein